MRKALVLLALVTMSMNGQNALAPLHVEPQGAGRSPEINLDKGDIVRVVAEPEGELNPAIFVFEAMEGLLAKNNEDAETEGFEWTAPQKGRYHLVIYSRSPRPMEYRITVFPPEPARPLTDGVKPVLATVPVYYATNRTLLSSAPVSFGNDPAGRGELRLGKVKVDIPLDHRMGNIEYPSILRLEFRQDRARHFVAGPAELMDPADYWAELAGLISRSDEKDALVFVHGFNTTFEDASLRTAQLAYDLSFKGPAVLFTWPSQGTLFSYLQDGRNADLSASPLRDLLKGLSEQAHVRRIHVIAHSMGNRVLTNALTKMGSMQSAIREIALIAPDIDAALFRELAEQFPTGIGPIALYASSQDKALAASEKLAGYARAGQGGKNILVVPGVESIDASAVDTSAIGLGHQYYWDSSEILSDLYYFFRGQPPDRRFALRPSADRRYWIFSPSRR
jgi:esterase/lipase superfamily enzyme